MNGDWVTIITARTAVQARALVTSRIRPFVIAGRPAHHIAASYHFGRKGLVTGDPINELFAIAGEPNTTIPGSKIVSVAVLAGRSATGRNVVTSGAVVGEATADETVRRDIAAVGPM